LRGIVLVSIPWGIAVHTVTAFLYSGLPGRSLWFTTILAPRFLASAFATSAALLILVCLSLRRYAAFDAGAPALRRLGTIMTYALFANLFLLLPELFSVLYARVPDSYASLSYLYVGLEGHAPLVPLMWWSVTMSLVALVALLLSWRRRPDAVLAGAALLVLSGVGLDKGFGLIIAGFVPGPLGTIPVYVPTLPEWAVVIGIWGLGALIVTVTYRVALASPVPMVREPLEQT
jgi:molybdopterin-containing oxidoreductase family membrane subunit